MASIFQLLKSKIESPCIINELEPVSTAFSCLAKDGHMQAFAFTKHATYYRQELTPDEQHSAALLENITGEILMIEMVQDPFFGINARIGERSLRRSGDERVTPPICRAPLDEFRLPSLAYRQTASRPSRIGPVGVSS
jgi:hypothetical protein